MKMIRQGTLQKDKITLELLQNEVSQSSDILLKRWEEAIFHENVINPRSYHSAIVFKNSLYIYGGYEYNHGIMNDFYCIELDSKEHYVWKPIEKKKDSIYPGINNL